MTTWNKCFFQSPSTPLMELISSMHDYVFLFLASILILVLMLSVQLAYIKNFGLEFFENHQLEFVWTIVPFFILMFMLIPSLSCIFMMDSCLFCGLSISIMGHQWYWSYFFKITKDYFFDSYMLPSESSAIRLLEVDNRLMIPSNFPVRFLVSSSDVLHSWTVPSFGVKMDAVPGRINQFCVSPSRVGVFFGQCSEICGANHSFMPIVVESLPFDKFFK